MDRYQGTNWFDVVAYSNDRDSLISAYYHIGFRQHEIVTALDLQHGFQMTQRHLRRILRRLNLYRKEHKSDVEAVAEFITKQISGSGKQNGYRIMHQKCIMAGYVVSRETVRLLLGIIDPEGVELRKRRKFIRRRYYARGPDFVWHLDSYDKLRPYGISINGCIDGFSRKLIWLSAWSTSSDPKIIAGYFLQAVAENMGCPRVVRGDRGTENKTVELIQKFFRDDDDDEFAGEKSFLYGKRTSNQGIESWWSFLRKQLTEFWISHFHLLQSYGFFEGTYLDKELVRFCYLDMIQV